MDVDLPWARLFPPCMRRCSRSECVWGTWLRHAYRARRSYEAQRRAFRRRQAQELRWSEGGGSELGGEGG